jgi:aspartate kinase
MMDFRKNHTSFTNLLSMSLIIQKYGGTSMGSPERIREVAKRIAQYHAQGHQLVVVPSAMSGETNRLLGLAKQLSDDPSGRELDVIASTGEQVSVGWRCKVWG